MERARVEREFEEILERIDARIAAFIAMASSFDAAGLPAAQLAVLQQQALDAHARLGRMRARTGGWDALRGQLDADVQALDETLQHWSERLARQPNARIALT